MDGAGYTAQPFRLGQHICMMFVFNDRTHHTLWLHHLSTRPFPDVHFRSWDEQFGLGITSEDGRNGLLVIMHNVRDPLWRSVRSSSSIHFFTPREESWASVISNNNISAADLQDGDKFIYSKVPVIMGM